MIIKVVHLGSLPEPVCGDLVGHEIFELFMETGLEVEYLVEEAGVKEKE